jgi:hypothetical protein
MPSDEKYLALIKAADARTHALELNSVQLMLLFFSSSSSSFFFFSTRERIARSSASVQPHFRKCHSFIRATTLAGSIFEDYVVPLFLGEEKFICEYSRQLFSCLTQYGP